MVVEERVPSLLVQFFHRKVVETKIQTMKPTRLEKDGMRWVSEAVEISWVAPGTPVSLAASLGRIAFGGGIPGQ